MSTSRFRRSPPFEPVVVLDMSPGADTERPDHYQCPCCGRGEWTSEAAARHHIDSEHVSPWSDLLRVCGREWTAATDDAKEYPPLAELMRHCAS